MQKQYIQYLGQFKPLVQIVGQKPFTSKVEEYLNNIDVPMKQSFNIVQMEKINFKYQRYQNNISQSYNDNGVMKYHWIDKQQKYKPSVLVKVYDWTSSIQQEGKSWDQKLGEIQQDYWDLRKEIQGRRGQGQTKTMVIIFFGQNAAQPGGEQIFGRLKDILDLDNKKLYLVTGDLDTISTVIRKIRKNIEDQSKSYYDTLHKKYKKAVVAKPLTVSQKENNIKYSIKLAIIGEIQALLNQKGYDKPIKQNQTSYQLIHDEIFNNYKQACSLQVQRKQQKVNHMNLDAYYQNQKLQELRYLGDLVMFRKLQLCVQDNRIRECFDIFEVHFKEYKDKVINYDFRFNFTEYKWREEIFKQFTYMALELFHNNEKILKDNKEILLRFINILIGSVIYGQERYEMFTMIQNSINKDQNFEIKISPEVYFGRNNYELIDSNKKVNDVHLEAERLLQECLESTLIDEGNQNILNENFTVLNLGYELKNYLNQRQIIQIRFYLLKNYSLTENFDQFKIVAEDLIGPAIQFKMNDILVFIIEKYEKFLTVWNQDNEKQIKFNLDLLLLKSESIDDKLKRLQNIELVSHNLLENQEINIEMFRDNKLYDIEVKYDKTSFSIEESVQFTLIAQLKSDFKANFLNKIEIYFTNQSLKIEKILDENMINEKNQIVLPFSLDITHLVEQNINTQIKISKIVFSKQFKTQTEGTININFNTSDRNISYTGCRDAVYLDRIESRIIVNTQISNPLYINELFEVNVLLRKEDKNPKETIQNIQVALNSKNDKIKSGANQFQIYYINDNSQNKKKYQSGLKFPLQFPQQEVAKPVSFYIRANYELEEIIQIEVNYELKSENKVKKRRISDYQKIKIINPFITIQEWKVCNDAYLNLQCKNNNAPNSNEQILPLKQLCSQKFSISIVDKPIWIHNIEYQIQAQDQVQVVKQSTLEKPIQISKGDFYNFNLFIKTIQELKNVPLGNLIIQYNRNDKIEEPNELNSLNFKLSDITVQSNKYQINVEAPTHTQLGEFFNMNFKLTNTQQRQVRLEISIIDNKDRKDFIIAGKTTMYIAVEANNTFEYQFKLMSLECGQLKLPGIQVNCFLSNQEKLLVSDSSEQKQIIVLP